MMKIKWADIWLSDGTVFLAQNGWNLNGNQIVQEQSFVRATEKLFFARKNRLIRLSFEVNAVFSTIVDAEVFAATHYSHLEDGPATLLLRCGGVNEEDTVDVLIQNAVLEGVREPQYRGASVTVGYQFVAPKITSAHVSESGGGGGGIDEEAEMASRTVAIPNGVDGFPVTGMAWPAVPVRVLPHVVVPADGLLIHAHVKKNSVTDDGFYVYLSGVTDSADYLLDFQYVF